MKKIFYIITLLCIIFLTSVKASLPLSGKVIVIDPGHGGKDAGTSYANILEKDINLNISFKLQDELIKSGCSVILTRDGDYDLGSPNALRRKKSDFDNRIELINNSHADIYLSIHTNYLEDSTYFGGQTFYYGDINKMLAEKIQSRINTLGYTRSVKQMPNVYMYRQLSVKGVLIETGFLSNAKERNLLISDEYQTNLSKIIVAGIIDYFN